eukprot:gene5261-5795_t
MSSLYMEPIHHPVISGELLYHLCGFEQINLIKDDSVRSQLLHQFLGNNRSATVTISTPSAGNVTEANNTSSNNTNDREEIAALQALRDQVEMNYQSTVHHLTKGLSEEIDSVRRSLMVEVLIERELAHTELKKDLHRFDAAAMQSILQYASVIKADMEAAKRQLAQERQEKEILKQQARVCRDFLLFSCHLNMESRGRIDIVCLPHQSTQFQRCVKAVHDNLNDVRSPEEVRILNVFKIKHQALAHLLHAATMKVGREVKARGLFCCLSAEEVGSFAVHGLAAWRKEEVQANGRAFSSSLPTDSLLSLPWVFLSPTPLLPLRADLQAAYSNAGTAARIAAERPCKLERWRFSRFSSLSDLIHQSEESLQKGVFLCLCRVLLVRQKTLAAGERLSERAALQAASEGYDSLYSPEEDEYILLQPAFVLPEFFIHTHFRSKRSIQEKEVKRNPWSILASCNEDSVDLEEGSIMTLLANTTSRLSPSSPSKTTSDGKKDGQEAVRIKQNALLRIEEVLQDFKQRKKQLLVDICARLRDLRGSHKDG